MEITWLRRPAFLVMGTVTRLSLFTRHPDAITRIWQEFNSHREHIQSISMDRAFYGIRFPDEKEGTIEYLAGMAVKKAFTTPAGLIVREIASARYAVFRCLPSQVEETYQSVNKDWKILSPAIPDPEAPCFEQYPSNGAADPYILLHIPVID